MKKEEIKQLRINKSTWLKILKYAKPYQYGDTHDSMLLRILDKLDKSKQH